MADPVHQNILLVDIEGAGGGDDVVRRVRRHHMYETISYVLEAAEVGAGEHRKEDRGDGVLVLVSAAVSKVALLRAVLAEVPARLRAYNRTAADSAQVRLRVVLAAGEVALDELPGVLGGALGWDLDQAFRLLDGDPLRAELRARRGRGGAWDALVCVSDAVYRGVVRHDHRGIASADFHPVTVPGKEGPVRGWVFGEPAAGAPAPDAGAAEPPPTPGAEPAAGPAADRAAEPAAEGTPSRTTDEDRGGERGEAPAVSQSFGGARVAGDLYGVAGGQVTGDVVLGDKIVGGAPRDGDRR
ncbi:hypothetical protein RM844_15530 [Streptomyces sp. DSM 44915]|uniref:Uncharacterized protein n=1 Tax=Streptomyces chisholmiae TaxID=3075540 RepID=A0ABU2JS01_9ACTN|nr:hypothetical protein [Streptomyces sp. DSM 44915]MDT0267697.1 hypothetical protein [Streptomyces sp. DSM 44915]